MTREAGTSQTEGARLFREAWIGGLHQHFPSEPKVAYVNPWVDTPQRNARPRAAGSVYEPVRQFIEISGGTTARLPREQKSRFAATCWAAQMFKRFDDPKSDCVAD